MFYCLYSAFVVNKDYYYIFHIGEVLGLPRTECAVSKSLTEVGVTILLDNKFKIYIANIR